ncbi:MAG: helix-turn-helix domain-containing protein [Marinifilaceae bacterium]|jgi:AraC-like DNA-binding protein|nr:helix-turn-helix domain-containing protein [Marinifilaceae bacterium]
MLHFDKLIDIHKFIGIGSPKHPHISIFRLSDINLSKSVDYQNITIDFYNIVFHKGDNWTLEYGNKVFEFGDSGLSFIAPKQLISLIDFEETSYFGYSLLIHPDFLKKHNLENKISEYNFFSYDYYKSAKISAKEESLILKILNSIEFEYKKNKNDIDESIVLKNTELLFLYATRAYKSIPPSMDSSGHEILIKAKKVLNNFYRDNIYKEKPSVNYLAEQLNLSPNNLTVYLKKTIGLSAQQFIHTICIEHAKYLLENSQLSVSDISYELGFEYPQSFNKFFKRKLGISPIQYRKTNIT